MDAVQWDERYAGNELVWGAAPNRWVEQEVATLTPASVLDLADNSLRVLGPAISLFVVDVYAGRVRSSPRRSPDVASPPAVRPMQQQDRTPQEHPVVVPARN